MSREFFKAVTDGNVVLIREMLDVDPALASAKDEKGFSAILKATYYGKKEVAALLLESQVELNIFEAAATGQTQRVRELIKEGAASVNVYSADGFFPLALAVFFGHLNTVEVLLAAGADINAVSREAMKVAPINSAAANGQLEIARVLIAHGANVDAQAVDGFRPLHEAAARGNIEFAALLLANGADINAKTATGKTPLAFALEKEQTEMAALLRGRGGIA